MVMEVMLMSIIHLEDAGISEVAKGSRTAAHRTTVSEKNLWPLLFTHALLFQTWVSFGEVGWIVQHGLWYR